VTALERARGILHALKHPADPAHLPRIPVFDGGETVAALRPVPSDLRGEATSDARLMADWRNLHKESFFTWVTSTEASSRYWLETRYAPDDGNLIVMVETLDRRPFGHLALDNFREDADGRLSCEYGRILRGLDIGPKGGMALASAALLRWAARELQVGRVHLEVFDDNGRAKAIYRRLGFKDAGRRPVRKALQEGVLRWVDAEENPENWIAKMEWTAPGGA
jgi:RimJ/RimL family protein N-acetyltransferase